MLSLRIASRFLRTSPAQTALIIAGIAVGIAVQIFVGSLITSLQTDLIETTVGSSPHITLTAQDGGALPDADSIAGRIEKSEPLATSAVAVRTFSAISAGDSESGPLSLTGGDAAGLDTIYGLSSRIVQGRYSLEPGDILVGTGFATSRDVDAGDSIELLAPDGSARSFVVSGVFDLGAAAANERVAFVDPATAADVLGMNDGEYSAVYLQLTDVFASAEVAQRLASDLDVEAVDWQSQNSELLAGLQAQSGSSALIQAFVLVAVALGIASTLAISAVQKTRQIGILKAMGMGDGSAGLIFLWQAAILGAGGSLAGLGLGWLLIAGFGLAPVPFSIRIEPGFAAISACVGVLVALASAIIPTRKTSRLDPIEVIQSG